MTNDNYARRFALVSKRLDQPEFKKIRDRHEWVAREFLTKAAAAVLHNGDPDAAARIIAQALHCSLIVGILSKGSLKAANDLCSSDDRPREEIRDEVNKAFDAVEEEMN